MEIKHARTRLKQTRKDSVAMEHVEEKEIRLSREMKHKSSSSTVRLYSIKYLKHVAVLY